MIDWDIVSKEWYFYIMIITSWICLISSCAGILGISLFGRDMNEEETCKVLKFSSVNIFVCVLLTIVILMLKL